MTMADMLYDGSTGELLGPATRDQADGSYAARAQPSGIITIDTVTGDVIHPKGWTPNPTRTVYVAYCEQS